MRRWVPRYTDAEEIAVRLPNVPDEIVRVLEEVGEGGFGRERVFFGTRRVASECEDVMYTESAGFL
jgi:hypothetical protein